jgi:hypothetical protein
MLAQEAKFPYLSEARSCCILGITGSLEFVHFLEFSKHKTFRKLDLFPSSREGLERYRLSLVH